MKIVTLTGSKNCGKDVIAEKLSENSDVVYLKPYTDKKPLSSAELIVGYNVVSKNELDQMIKDNEVLSITRVNGHRWVYFKFQLTEAYNIMIVDDYGVCDVRTNWNGDLYSVKVVSKNMQDSDRVGVYLYNHDFDEVFDYDSDDFDELEARII